MPDSTNRIGDELGAAVERAIASAESTVERVGDRLEEAISRTVASRVRRRRVRRITAAALVSAAAAVIAVGLYEQQAGRGHALRERGPEVVAESSLVRIVRVVPPGGAKADCFRVDARSGTNHTLVCPQGEAARFETYATPVAGGETVFYGRAALPEAAQIVLRFPGGHAYRVRLQRDGFWAWDAPDASVTRMRSRLIVLAVTADGRPLARDTHSAARAAA